VETIGSKQSYALTWCMPNNDDDDDDTRSSKPLMFLNISLKDEDIHINTATHIF